jgi:DNA-binding HxlR family transcriptional regulator
MTIQAFADLNRSIARPLNHPERFEYRLAEKGRGLQPVLLAMLAWGDRYTAGPAGPALETVHAERRAA